MKKNLNLCLRWHILKSYRFVAEVTFKHETHDIKQSLTVIFPLTLSNEIQILLDKDATVLSSLCTSFQIKTLNTLYRIISHVTRNVYFPK